MFNVTLKCYVKSTIVYGGWSSFTGNIINRRLKKKSAYVVGPKSTEIGNRKAFL